MTDKQHKIRLIYKLSGIALLLYAIVYGLLMTIPNLGILEHSWRNLYYHVPMWYAMMIMLLTSVYHSIKHLNSKSLEADVKANNFAQMGVVFGILGLITGSIWSRVTWGAALASTDPTAWWAWDPKQTAALVLILIYFAYFLLRGSFDEPSQRGKVSAVYNVFGASMIIPLFYIVPKILGGLHPGSGDEGMLSALKDLGSEQRMVLYPAALGFILIGFWICEIRNRINFAENILEENS